MSSPEDLTNATKLLASQQESVTLSRVGRKDTSNTGNSAETSPQHSPQRSPTFKRHSLAPSSADPNPADESSHLKVDEGAIRQLRQLAGDEDEDEHDIAEDETQAHDEQDASDLPVPTAPVEADAADNVPDRPESPPEPATDNTDADAGPKRMDIVTGGEMPEDAHDEERTSRSDGTDDEHEPASEESEVQSIEPLPAPRLRKSEPATQRKAPRPPSLLSLGSPNRKAAPSVQGTGTSRSAIPPSSRTSIQGPSREQDEDDSEDDSTEASTEHEDGGEDDDGEDDEEEEEEPEPTLKYQRLKGSVPDVLRKDSVSIFAVCEKFLALGTHAGMVFILDFQGNLIKAFKSHSASVLDIDIDSSFEFVSAASIDGLLSICSLNSAEHYTFDFKRPMRTVSLEPGFGKRTSRAFVCGGMAGALIHREKGWLGHKETVIHAGEGPIWSCRWRGNLIAWANDRGVRIYDTNTKQKITYIAGPTGKSHSDIYRCNLFWQDDRTLIVAWADEIKFVSVKERESRGGTVTAGNLGLPQAAQLYAEITKVFRLDCAISGIAPYGSDILVLAYLTESDDSDDESDSGDGESFRNHRRKRGQPPELRILDPKMGEEKSSDVLSLAGFERLSCNDYRLLPSHQVLANDASSRRRQKTPKSKDDKDIFYVVSPMDVIIARPRDQKDHIDWLLEHKKYEAALDLVEAMGRKEANQHGFDADQIGRDYLTHLVDELGDYERAAKAGQRILGKDVKAWEEWIFLYLERGQLSKVVDFVPTEDPVLPSVVYDMILAHFLRSDLVKLKAIANLWPPEIYSTQAVALAIEDRLQSSPTAYAGPHSNHTQPWTAQDDEEQKLLMEVLADLYVRNRQPGKSLPYYLRLRRPGVFDLIRENNLFLDVRDQARQLIEFEEVVHPEEADEPKGTEPRRPGRAIQLLVDHVHSIPPQRVVAQLEAKPRYLHQYLDALFDIDPQLVAEYSDLQVELYAQHDSQRLMHYLRAMSSYYSFEKAYRVCELHDFVPEMVFLLGRVGDNKRALSLIIERLGDVSRAIDFAKEQNDDDLWEDLLRYSESKPAFIRGLLENVGAEIDPIRLIRRIRDGLHIPGLKEALCKILSDFGLQISLLEGCLEILYADVRSLSADLQSGQMQGWLCEAGADSATGNDSRSMTGTSPQKDKKSSASKTVTAGATLCATCQRPLLLGSTSRTLQDDYLRSRADATDGHPAVLFLCRHAHHLTCLLPPLPASDRSGAHQSQIPPRRKRATHSGEDEKLGLGAGSPLAMATTATQIASRARLRLGEGADDAGAVAGSNASPHDASDSIYSSSKAMQRTQIHEEEWRGKLAYSGRLKVALRRVGAGAGGSGCPTCRSSGVAA